MMLLVYRIGGSSYVGWKIAKSNCKAAKIDSST